MIETKWMRVFLITALFVVVVGCDAREPVTRADVLSKNVTEITLEDGTRCVIFRPLANGTGGGISCDWNSKEPPR